MSKIPLPPPPGFTRKKKEFGSSKRYVYPFARSRAGWGAEKLHEEFLAYSHQQWMSSKLRRLAIRHGRRAYRQEYGEKEIVSPELAAKIGMTELSMNYYPLFVRRDPLSQVFEHLRHQPRYFMKIDIYDAFGCVYPGFHESFPEKRVSVRTGPDLFDIEELVWNGWPFYHQNQKGLIQGAPSSPLLFEQACQKTGLDNILRETARANNAVVTRYVDDIIFSRLPWDGRPFGYRVYETLCARIKGCGFRLNFKKCRRNIDIYREPIEFLGVSASRSEVKARPAFFQRMADLGVMTEGHLSWLEQIEQLKLSLQLIQRKRGRQ